MDAVQAGKAVTYTTLGIEPRTFFFWGVIVTIIMSVGLKEYCSNISIVFEKFRFCCIICTDMFLFLFISHHDGVRGGALFNWAFKRTLQESKKRKALSSRDRWKGGGNCTAKSAIPNPQFVFVLVFWKVYSLFWNIFGSGMQHLQS